MKERGEDPLCSDGATYKAISNYSNVRFGALAREASAQLERLDATGIFGHKLGFRTRWDEYCHEIQEGPPGATELDCAKTVGPMVLAIVRAIDNSEAALFAIGARWHLKEKTDQDVVGVPDLIQHCLEEAIETLALLRDMSDFDAKEEAHPWPIRVEDVVLLERLLEAVRSLATLAQTGNDLIALGEVCGAIENILESKIVDVNVGLTVGFRHGDTAFEEGIFACISVNANKIVLDELHTTYSSDVGSDHFTKFYTSLEPGGGFDEAEIGDWIAKLEELCAWEEAGLSVERNG